MVELVPAASVRTPVPEVAPRTLEPGVLAADEQAATTNKAPTARLVRDSKRELGRIVSLLIGWLDAGGARLGNADRVSCLRRSLWTVHP
jgi:hypothetical protein